MEILSGFYNTDIHSSPLVHQIQSQKQNQFLTQETMPAVEIKEGAYLEKTREYFESLKKDLDTQITSLEKIKAEGLQFEKDKKSGHIANAKTAVKEIEMFFMDSHYRGTQYGDDAMFGDGPPPYTFWVKAGPFTDQWENFRLATLESWRNIPEVMKYDVLGLDALDVTKPSGTWMPIIDKAIAVFRTETDKIASFLQRLDFFKTFQNVQTASMNGYWNMKKRIISENPEATAKKLLAAAAGYTKIAHTLLDEIKRAALENKKRLAEKKGNADLVFRVRMVIDEIDRLASHGQFNGMSLLTGNFAPGGYFQELVLYPETNNQKKIALILPGMNAHKLCEKIFPIDGWDIRVEEAFSTANGTDKVITGCAAAGEVMIRQLDTCAMAGQELFKAQLIQQPFLLLEAEKRLKSVVREYGLPEKKKITVKAGASVTEQALVFCAVLYTAYEDAFSLLTELRTINELLCNSVYTSAEREQLQQKAAGITLRLNTLNSEYTFSGARVFPKKSPYDLFKKPLILGVLGSFKKILEYNSIDTQTLGIADSEIYNGWNYSLEYANRELGAIDNAFNILWISRESVLTLIESCITAETVSPYFKMPPADNDSTNKLFQNEAAMARQMRMQLEQALFYALCARSHLYTHADREIMSKRISSVLSDMEVVAEKLNQFYKEAKRYPVKDGKIISAWERNTVTVASFLAMYATALKPQGAIKINISEIKKADELYQLLQSFQNKIQYLGDVNK
ncbi:MAG: hypothetical protein JW904_10805 [Spirochaetales bacterium]|nr:hypothetical protein [Spirochaetales bacterium]